MRATVQAIASAVELCQYLMESKDPHIIILADRVMKKQFAAVEELTKRKEEWNVTQPKE